MTVQDVINGGKLTGPVKNGAPVPSPVTRVTRWDNKVLAKFIVWVMVIFFITFLLVAVVLSVVVSHVDANTDRSLSTAKLAKINTTKLVESTYAECLESQERAQRLNGGFDRLIAMETANHVDSLDRRTTLIDIYRSMKREPVPVCKKAAL
jgi:hypothetical protein